MHSLKNWDGETDSFFGKTIFNYPSLIGELFWAAEREAKKSAFQIALLESKFESKKWNSVSVPERARFSVTIRWRQVTWLENNFRQIMTRKLNNIHIKEAALPNDPHTCIDGCQYFAMAREEVFLGNKQRTLQATEILFSWYEESPYEISCRPGRRVTTQQTAEL